MPTIPDDYADLLSGTVTLVTVNADGYPQATAVVTKLDGGVLHTSINDARQKYKNLTARPKATVFAIDPANPYRTIEVRADAELIPDPDKSWTKAFLPGFDVDAVDGDARRFHVVLTPVKVNVYPPR
mgnify:CR=1 FL=1